MSIKLVFCGQKNCYLPFQLIALGGFSKILWTVDSQRPGQLYCIDLSESYLNPKQLANMTDKPEDKAREKIDEQLEKSGWRIYAVKDANIHSAQGVVLRSFPMKPGHGEADTTFFMLMEKPPV